MSTTFRRGRSGLYIPRGGGGGSLAAWVTAVTADTPWAAWKTIESSSPLADSSGNSRAMGIGGSPTMGQVGPGGFVDAIRWDNNSAYFGSTTATLATSAATLEAWAYLTSNPGANTLIMGLGEAGTFDKSMYVDTAGKVNFYVYNGSGQNLAASAALSLNTWHHIVCSVGAAGTKIRVDQTTLGTNGSVTSSFSSAQIVHIRNRPGTMNGGFGAIVGTDLITIGPTVVFASQLSDTRTDAHKTALVP